MKGTLHEGQCTFLITSRSVPFRMRNVSEKIVEKIKTHIFCSMTFLKYRAVYEVMWKDIVQPGRPKMKIWRIAC